MRTIEVQVNNSLSTERMIGSLSTVFGFLATLLAVIGPDGVMAYTVALVGLCVLQIRELVPLRSGLHLSLRGA